MAKPERNKTANAAAQPDNIKSAGGPPFGGPNRSMPESFEAEAAVLGSMMQDPQCISEIVLALKADAFYTAAHQMMFEAIVSLYEKNTEGADRLRPAAGRAEKTKTVRPNRRRRLYCQGPRIGAVGGKCKLLCNNRKRQNAPPPADCLCKRNPQRGL